MGLKQLLIAFLLSFSCCKTMDNAVPDHQVQIQKDQDDQDKAEQDLSKELEIIRNTPLPNLPIVLDNPIDENSSALFKAELDGELLNKPDKITIVIDSPGGDVVSGRKIIRAIEGAPVPTDCISDGMTASMAFYILQSCTIREMTKRSFLMAHHAAFQDLELSQLSEIDAKNYWGYLHSLNNALEEQTANRMKVSLKFIKHKLEFEQQWWMNWKEALKVGAVDKIAPIPNEKDKAKIKQIMDDYIKKLKIPDKL
ncbi:MAG: ATP-dependent Clp protease proteolytic subunit [Elusimicrobia bacterium]|nr:ATP-dependent Clp protease proteolytic subunit [Elusimicrobiota bacterium]